MFEKQREIECVSKAQSDFYFWKPKEDWGEILFSGGYGSGKSFSLALKALSYIGTPNTDVALGRLSAMDVKRSVWELMITPWDTPDGVTHEALIPQGAIKKFDPINNYVEFWNRSKLHFVGVEDLEKNRSRQFHAGIGEELSEWSQEQFTTFSARCRKIHPLGNVVACASNAVPKHHWMYKYFVLSAVKGEVECFISPTTDNIKNLPAGYLKKLERYSPKQKERFLQGLFVSDGETVFYCFSPDHHVTDKCPFTPKGHILSQDFGGGAGMSACHHIAYGEDADGRLLMHIADELVLHRARHIDIMEWQDEYADLTDKTVVYDGANASLRNDMVALGWQCHKGIKNLADSFVTVNSLFTEGRLTIDPKCDTVINQLQGAEYEKESERTNKRTGWDAIDSVRYGVCFLERTLYAMQDYETAVFGDERETPSDADKGLGGGTPSTSETASAEGRGKGTGKTSKGSGKGKPAKGKQTAVERKEMVQPQTAKTNNLEDADDGDGDEFGWGAGYGTDSGEPEYAYDDGGA